MTDHNQNGSNGANQVKKDFTYLHERLLPLGWTEENNLFEVERTATDGTKEVVPNAAEWARGLPPAKRAATIKVKVPLFDADEEGNILIPYYYLNGGPCTYKRGSNISRPYVLKRLRRPRFDVDGKEHKYEIPAGAGTFPWIPPNVMECYRSAIPIDTLVLTEGAIKAFSGYIRGLYIIGLTSITHYKDRAIETLHSEILEVIKRCKPRNVIWLVDGDCRSLTKDWQKVMEQESEPAEKKDLPDLARKPNLFFSSADKIRELLKDYEVDTYFAHVQSDSVAGSPKGLDDLFLAYRELKGAEARKTATAAVSTHKNGKKLDAAAFQKAMKKAEYGIKDAGLQAMADADAEVVQDLTTFSQGSPRFIHRMNIRQTVSRLRTYFGLGGAEQFYQTYSQLIGDRVFNYMGTHYRWIADKSELEMLVPSASRDYCRVGDGFYEWVRSPRLMRDGKMVIERVLDSRRISTIKSDHGDKFLKHIPRYKRFCNMPDHENYQQVVHNCLNLYYPFEHKPEKGDPSSTLAYLAHVFGTGTVSCTHPRTGARYSVKELDLGLDYLQLLYQKPAQMLPILCLVSLERNTGKSTLAKWLKLLFTHNAVMVGNADFENDFNAVWASRLLVMCDEAFIDKKKVIERIKSLSTADRIVMNAKGVDQKEVDFFAKFILLSNNEENFASIDAPEVRFWVRKVPVIPEGTLNVDLLGAMREEIPAFLHYLGQRKLATENLFRAWFDPRLLVTDALKRVVEHSQPNVIRELHEYMRELFFRTRLEVILMDADDVRLWVFGGSRYERKYINKLISEVMKLDRYRREEDNKYVTKDYEFPAFQDVKDHGTGNWTRKRVTVTGNGRPFVFRREDFVSNEEWDAHHFETALVMPTGNGHSADRNGNGATTCTSTNNEEDLPF